MSYLCWYVDAVVCGHTTMETVVFAGDEVGAGNGVSR